jgi:hypothetical protein
MKTPGRAGTARVSWLDDHCGLPGSGKVKKMSWWSVDEIIYPRGRIDATTDHLGT